LSDASDSTADWTAVRRPARVPNAVFWVSKADFCDSSVVRG
jgi:hypothetical protein